MGVTVRASAPPDRDQLVTDHLGLVRALAQRLAQRLPTQVELNDLISVGVMGLIDAAGRYRIADPTTGAEGVVLLPVRRDPSGGSTGASFRITWAAEPASADLVYDVQIERPGGPFESWVTGVTTRRAHFVPDSGPGEYRFRARVRDAVSGAMTGWSPPRGIAVS